MTALPGATTKVFLDSADDDPKQARTELVDMLDKFNTMRDYLSGLLGTDGTPATGRTNLGVEGDFAVGTEMIFGDSTLPTGWSHNTARNDEVVRIVSGAGNTSGGSVSISGGTIPAVVASALSIAQLALHGHPWRTLTSWAVPNPSTSGGLATINITANEVNKASYTGTPSATLGQQIGGEGSGSTHGHNGGSYNIKFRDYVSATKD